MVIKSLICFVNIFWNHEKGNKKKAPAHFSILNDRLTLIRTMTEGCINYDRFDLLRIEFLHICLVFKS